MKHLFRILIVVSLSLSIFGLSSAQDDDMKQISQWAKHAEASTQYSDDSWSALQATGSPNASVCGDDVNAWASEGVTEEEWLILQYSEAVIPTQINIYQNYNPGAIIGVAVAHSSMDDPIIIENTADPSDECPSVFSVNLPEGLPEINAVILVLDQTIVGDWNEIDAVELVGFIEGDPDDSEETSLESGDYPEYTVFSNTGSTPPKGGPGSGPGSSSNADYDVEWGTDVTCDDGGEIVNGVELQIIQQRTGNQYRVTAIGIDGFDPTLAVTLTGNYSDALCNDDDSDAADYSADLPTTGQVSSSGSNSQVIFNLNSSEAFENVSIIVGGYDNSSGEFLIVIEGMYAGESDGLGDPFSLPLSPALYESGVTPTAYMVAITNSFDPLMFMVDADYNILNDSDGDVLGCDDAGNSDLCWGESAKLSGAYVSRSSNRQLPGGNLDAMMSVPFSQDEVGFYFNYMMSGNESYGDYLVVFHLGIKSED